MSSPPFRSIQTIVAGAIGMILASLSGPASGGAQGVSAAIPAPAPRTTRPSLDSSRQNTGPSAKVSLTVEDSSVLSVLQALARQAHLRLVYDEASPLFTKSISIRVLNVGVMDALAIAVKGTGLVVKLGTDSTTVMVRPRTNVPAEGRPRQGTGRITGRVTDSVGGHGLGGANIEVQGMKLSAVSSPAGDFVVTNVPAGDQVVTIRLFGYRPLTRSVAVADDEPAVLRVVMHTVPTVLSGVVTTASGVQRRREVGNDITVINADSVQRVAPVSSVTDLLETRVPGLTVLHTSGAPGAPSRLRLRGVSSPNANNDPILIIDGIRANANQSGDNLGGQAGGPAAIMSTRVQTGSGILRSYAGPSPLDQIDPNSIETIEVFKGPSAAAMYGSDAANGVIVITTKRGRVGPTHWSASASQGTSALPGNWPTNYFPYTTLYNGASAQCTRVTGSCGMTPVDSIVQFQALNVGSLSPVGRGHTGDGAVNVSGGNGTLRYSLGGNVRDEGGMLRMPALERRRFALLHGFAAPGWMVRPEKFRAWEGNSRLDIDASHKITVALTSILRHQEQQQSSLSGAIDALQGLYMDTTFLLSSNQAVLQEYYERVQQRGLTTTNALNAQWPVAPWLLLRADAGFNLQTTTGTTLTPRGYVMGASDSVGFYAAAHRSDLVRTLNLSGVVAVNHVSLPIGLNFHTTTQSGYEAQTTGIPLGVERPTQFLYANGGPNETSISTSTYGWYVAPTFSVSSRLFFSPGFRLDGGSASGANAGLTALPKFDISWIALDRTGQAPLWGVVSQLRPRAAFGVAGVQPGPAEKLRLFSSGTTSLNGGANTVDVVSLGAFGNTRLEPERNREIEGGLDADLWGDRVTLSVSGYRKTAYKAIMAVATAPSSGSFGASIATNVGTVRNSGLEASASAVLVDLASASWRVNGNVQKNSNLVVSMIGAPLGATGGSLESRVQAGYPLFAVFARPIASYADANKNGYIDPGEFRIADSAVYIGSPYTNYELSLGTTVSLFNGRLSVSTAADYQNGLTQGITGGGGENIVRNLANNPATPLAVQAAALATASVCNGATYGYCSATDYGVIQTVNLLRWTSLSVNIAAPRRVAQWLRVANASFALQGSNLGLHTNYRGKDPNVNAFSTGNSVQDTGQLPLPRTWLARITIGN